jgi:hypothetical protein
MTTNTDRFHDSMRYLMTYFPILAMEVDEALRGNINDEAAGALISLHGDHVAGSDDKRRALRALLLCQRAFLNGPYSAGADGGPFIYNNVPRSPIAEYRWSFESTVREAISCYQRRLHPTRHDLARDAEAIRAPQGGLTWETLRRSTTPFPAMPVCFDALKMLLFKSGFVSIRWLARTGPTMTAQTVNAILGQGVVVSEAALATMQPGYLFNFHRAGDMAVCHWGVSLGRGKAAGANTHAAWPGAPAPVNFFSGDSRYGIFTMRSSYDVCRFKYGLHGQGRAEVTIRQIDPEAVLTYF